MANPSNSTEALQKLQAIEQALHSQTMQRSTAQAQLMEIENAVRELEGAQESYRIIGNVMVKRAPAELKAELEERKAGLQTRASALERQEHKLREEMQRLQTEILGAQ